MQPRCTIAYAAPEILGAYAARQRAPADPAQDVWALGVIAYECLTFTRAFPAFSPAESVFAAAAGHAQYAWDRDDKARFLGCQGCCCVSHCTTLLVCSLLFAAKRVQPASTSLYSDIHARWPWFSLGSVARSVRHDCTCHARSHQHTPRCRGACRHSSACVTSWLLRRG